MRSHPAVALLSNGSYTVMITAACAGFELSYRHGSATYRIAVDNSAGTGRGVRSVELDGQPLPNNTVPLSDDGKNHNVSVELG